MTSSENNKVKRRDLEVDVHVRLPAAAPEGFPHIIDFDNIDEDNVPSDLTAVDAIASALYDFDVEALQDLLDMSKNKFYFGQSDDVTLTYVERTGTKVEAGSIQIETTNPEYKVQYEICPGGRWKMLRCVEYISGRQKCFSAVDHCRKCSGYDFDVAKALIMKTFSNSMDSPIFFIYEVNGKDMLQGADGDKVGEKRNATETTVDISSPLEEDGVPEKPRKRTMTEVESSKSASKSKKPRVEAGHSSAAEIKTLKEQVAKLQASVDQLVRKGKK